MNFTDLYWLTDFYNLYRSLESLLVFTVFTDFYNLYRSFVMLTDPYNLNRPFQDFMFDTNHEILWMFNKAVHKRGPLTSFSQYF